MDNKLLDNPSDKQETHLSMSIASHLIQYGVAGLLVYSARRKVDDKRTRVIVRGLRPRHFGKAFLTLIVCLAVALPLMQLPILNWGWYKLLTGHGGSVLNTTAGTNWMDTATAVLIVVSLFVCLPRMVHEEERDFRARSDRQTIRQRVVKQTKFGLAHLIMGIPLAAAIGLIVVGHIFLADYLLKWKRSGSRARSLLECARTHLAYDWIVVSIIAVAISIEITGKG